MGQNANLVSRFNMKRHRPTAPGERVILHIDMNSYFASVEELYDPSLKDRPFIVAGKTRRAAVVGSCNQLARKAGIRAGIPVFKAEALVPNITIVEPHFDRYAKHSELFARTLVEDFTPLVEVMSIDECYMDGTMAVGAGTPYELAERIQKDMLKKLGIGVSIGVSSNKTLAKVASDMKKPLGITELYPEDVAEKLWHLPVKNMLWVGPSTALSLNTLGIHTIRDLALANPHRLEAVLGSVGPALVEQANGKGSDVVSPTQMDAQSIGHSTTLPDDSTSYEELVEAIDEMCASIEQRAAAAHLAGNRVSLKLRDKAFVDRSRNVTLPAPVADRASILNASLALLDEMWNDKLNTRLLGVTLSGLSSADEAFEQASIFDYGKKRAKTTADVVAHVNDLLGERLVKTAGRSRPKKTSD